jgi:hypothetical protein
MISDILPYAVGVAISPVPIIAVILMLFSKRAQSNSLAFLGGWVLTLGVVGSVVLVLADAGKISAGGDATTLSYVVKLLLGVLLVYLAYRQWQNRPQGDEEPEMPGWMASIDNFTTGRSFSMAALLAGVNPKNLGLAVAAGMSIAEASSDSTTDAESWIVLIVFVIIASLSVAVPVLYYLMAGEAAEKTLDNWKAWLTANNVAVMAVLFLVLGAKLVGDGLGGLLE